MDVQLKLMDKNIRIMVCYLFTMNKSKYYLIKKSQQNMNLKSTQKSENVKNK